MEQNCRVFHPLQGWRFGIRSAVGFRGSRVDRYSFMKVVIICAFAIAAFMLAGCSHPTRSTASATSTTRSDTARLNQADVVRIAVEAATKHGYRLSDYKDPQVHYEFSRKDKTWSVFYDGKVPLPGHHFLVWVDDQTGAARVMPGE